MATTKIQIELDRHEAIDLVKALRLGRYSVFDEREIRAKENMAKLGELIERQLVKDNKEDTLPTLVFSQPVF